MYVPGGKYSFASHLDQCTFASAHLPYRTSNWNLPFCILCIMECSSLMFNMLRSYYI
ncbi:Uncharacterized protein APZ42_006258 [Daphnia magna]|nr:Uncharacterized protein APZ42_006258 [Daphnia magna]